MDVVNHDNDAYLDQGALYLWSRYGLIVTRMKSEDDARPRYYWAR